MPIMIICLLIIIIINDDDDDDDDQKKPGCRYWYEGAHHAGIDENGNQILLGGKFLAYGLAQYMQVSFASHIYEGKCFASNMCR